MKTFIFLAAISLITVNAYIDEWNLMHFPKFYDEISLCLNLTTDLWYELSNYIDVSMWKNYLLYELSHQFQVRTINVERMNRTLTNILNSLIRRNELNNNQTGQVKLMLMNALFDCEDDKIHSIQNEPGHHNLPSFILEGPNLSELLNLILVDLGSFIEETYQLERLCHFARNAMRVLVLSLVRYNSYSLSATLRLMWNIRAENFFDFANELPYIRHTYSTNFSTVYTRDDPNLFNTRMRTDYDFRDARASDEDILRVLSFHPKDQEYLHRSRFYSLRNRVAMTEADIYYEISENRFFRVLFVFLELVNRGYVDLYGNVAINQLIPEDLLQLLHNDTYYGPYLEMTGNRELNLAVARGSPSIKNYMRSLNVHTRILEPDVIMLLYLRLKSFVSTTNISMSTTISSGLSSTTGSEDSNKERKVTQTPPGNDGPKRQEKNNAMDSKNYYYYDPGPSCSKYYQNLQSPEKKTNEPEGCIMESGNSKQPPFYEEEKMLSEVLQDTLSTLYT